MHRRVSKAALVVALGALPASPLLADKPGDIDTLARCHFHQVGPGPEDFELDSARNRLLVSSVNRRGTAPDKEGHILAVPLSGDGLGDAVRLPLEGRDDARFHPVGISLVRGEQGDALYVIVRNVKPGHHGIERFRVTGNALLFEERIVDHLLVSPNELLALASGEVYVSNDSGRKKNLGKLFERLTEARWSTVVHYDGKGRWQKVAGRIAFANGLAWRKNGTAEELYVAAFQDERILVFHRDPRTGTLERAPRKIIRLAGLPDNLTWEDADHLIVAAHGNALRTGLHQTFGAKRAPSKIYRIAVREERPRPELLLEDSGSSLSAASTALIHGGRLYVSQLINDWIASCRHR